MHEVFCIVSGTVQKVHRKKSALLMDFVALIKLKENEDDYLRASTIKKPYVLL